MRATLVMLLAFGTIGCATTAQDKAQHSVSNQDAKAIELMAPVTISNLFNTHTLKAGIYIQTGADDSGEYYTPSTNNLITAPQIRGIYIPNDSQEICAVYYEFNNCEPASYKSLGLYKLQ